MTRALALLALLLPTSAMADGPWEAAPKKADTGTVTFLQEGSLSSDFWLLGGESLVLAVDLDSGEIGLQGGELPLSEAAVGAVSLVPTWMQAQLSLTLSKLEQSRQDEIAALLNDHANDLALDELAYSIAAMSPEELSLSWQYRLLEVLEANATAIYAIDPWVGFADLVELDDGSTTVEYHHDGGSYTIDKEIYYRHVVNPKLDMELPLFMDPESFSIDDPPGGVHWRDWIFFSALEDGTWDYRSHWLRERPYAVDDDDLAVLEAVGFLGDFEVDPIVVVADDDERPLLVEIDWGKGSVLATTLDLEAAHMDSHDFAANIFEYVQRRDVLEATEITLVVGDGGEAGAELLTHLEAEALPYELWDLGAGAPSLDGYAKLAVPGGLSAEAYDTLFDAESAEAIEAFVSAGGTLLLQADPVLGSSYDYPCGVYFEQGAVGTPAFLGHPVLAESLAGIDSLWDGVRYDGLSGERPLADATSAVDAIGWFVTQNMFDNVSEYAGTHSDYDGERSVWPQRIMHNHFGNCGECQDMMTAAARAALIPTMNVWSIEDHVWNEFYFEDGWHAWQVDWSDGPTRIDNGGVGADSTYGGGKEVSAIMGFHSNGFIADEHVALYTDTITATVTVFDSDGDPVPGAMVLVAVENYYYDQYLDQAAWVHTDLNGQVEITLGDKRNFWFLAAAELEGQEVWAPYSIPDIQSGTYPNWFLTNEAGDPVITAEEAVAGSSHEVSIPMGGRLERRPAQSDPPSGSLQVGLDLDLVLDDVLLDVPASRSYLGWYAGLGYAYGGGLIEALDEPGAVDLYLLSADNLALFEAGEAFEVIDQERRIGAGSSSLSLATPADQLYLVISNRGAPDHVFRGSLALDYEGIIRENAPDDEGGGCGCTASPRRAPVALLGLLTMLGLAVRRRR
jgi:MYXO-CTERM domain-containing protein